MQSDAGQSIFVEALSLPEPDRAKLAQELLRSLEADREAPPALDDATTLEAELDWRLQEVVDGTVQTMTVEQAQAFLAERRAGRRARELHLDAVLELSVAVGHVPHARAERRGRGLGAAFSDDVGLGHPWDRQRLVQLRWRVRYRYREYTRATPRIPPKLPLRPHPLPGGANEWAVGGATANLALATAASWGMRGHHSESDILTEAGSERRRRAAHGPQPAVEHRMTTAINPRRAASDLTSIRGHRLGRDATKNGRPVHERQGHHLGAHWARREPP